MTFIQRVRREIRNLTPKEWNDVVGCIWTMKNLTSTQGRELYGPAFRNYDDMVARHAHAALSTYGDQAHFGPVFAVFHRAWVLEFEHSMLSVQSTVTALPYWDISLDLHDHPRNKDSESIFSDRYLGSYVGTGKNFEVLDGSFANWWISTQPESRGLRGNVYGYLRHPLSINSAKYLTRRGGSMCGRDMALGAASSWDYCMESSVSFNIPSWDSCVEPLLHGPPHSAVAGSWPSGFTRSSPVNDSRLTPVTSCSQWFGFIAPPEGVDMSTAGTFTHPYALDCFVCVQCDAGDMQECGCKPRASHCGPLWTNTTSHREGTAGASHHHYSNCTQSNQTTDTTPHLFAESVPDDLYSYSYYYTEPSDPIDPPAHDDVGECALMTAMESPESMHVLGDFADPVCSPNDPIFPFHHANVDRHFETWLRQQIKLRGTSSMMDMNYAGFPSTGYAQGCNLYDVLSATDPFVNLFPDIDSLRNKPLTIQDILDHSLGEYTYDTISQSQPSAQKKGSDSLRGQSPDLQRSHGKDLFGTFFILCLFVIMILIHISH